MSVAVIVETRSISNLYGIVSNHVKYSGFRPIIFHGTLNENFVKEHLQVLACTFINLEVDTLNNHVYNRLLTSVEFWEQIPAEKILIFQHDSRLLRYGIEEFLQYDFIGANIATWPYPCLNGGLSLRSKSKMIEVIENVSYDGSVNEDIYFTRGIDKIGGTLPIKEVAQLFSVETIYSMGSVGYHAIDKYLTPEQCNEILNQYNG